MGTFIKSLIGFFGMFGVNSYGFKIKFKLISLWKKLKLEKYEKDTDCKFGGNSGANGVCSCFAIYFQG